MENTSLSNLIFSLCGEQVFASLISVGEEQKLKSVGTDGRSADIMLAVR